MISTMSKLDYKELGTYFEDTLTRYTAKQESKRKDVQYMVDSSNVMLIELSKIINDNIAKYELPAELETTENTLYYRINDRVLTVRVVDKYTSAEISLTGRIAEYDPDSGFNFREVKDKEIDSRLYMKLDSTGTLELENEQGTSFYSIEKFSKYLLKTIAVMTVFTNE